MRLFAVGHHMRVADADSYQAYEESYRRHEDEIAPCLSATRDNLLLFPEDAGLLGWFIGRRSLIARGASDSATAFNAMYAQRYRATDGYRERFPGISSARALTLAASDVAWRAVDGTFSGMAKRLGAHVIVSANLPYASRTTDSHDVWLFGDPDAADPAAYVAQSPELNNCALYYAPDGHLAGRVDKVYLTPSEENLLDMSSGRLDQVSAFELPFGKVGAAISRDAWYAPFGQRLEDLGVELVSQNEAFGGWTVEELPGDWLPDVMQSSGWTLTQKYRGLRYGAAPMLTGNLFDFFFDGQVWLSQKSAPDQSPRGFVGSNQALGWVDIGPWAFEDADRATLRSQGDALKPGSDSPLEGRYADSLVAADLSLYGGTAAPAVAVQPTAGVGAASVEVAPSFVGAQTNPDVAYDAAGTAWVVFSDARSGAPRTWVARSSDGGATFEAARAVANDGEAAQLRPAIVAGGVGQLWVVWQERSSETGAENIRLARTTDGARTFALSWVEPLPAAQWEPDLALRAGASQPVVVWADFRNGLAPHVRIWSGSGGSRAIDPRTVDLPRARPSQLQPTVAVDGAGRVAVAWIDYRETDWQVWASVDLAPALRVTPDHAHEVLGADPGLSVAPDGTWLIAWDELRERRAHHDVRAATLAPDDLDWQPLPLLLGGADDGKHVGRYRPSIGYLSGPVAVFQDLSYRKNGLSLARFGKDRVLPSRFDDTGDAANQLTRPRLAVRPDGQAGVVVFEDSRAGHSRVRASRISPTAP